MPIPQLSAEQVDWLNDHPEYQFVVIDGLYSEVGSLNYDGEYHKGVRAEMGKGVDLGLPEPPKRDA